MIYGRRQKKPVDCTNLTPFPVFRAHPRGTCHRKEKNCGGFRQSEKVYGVTGATKAFILVGSTTLLLL
jgi:hypothetical protein